VRYLTPDAFVERARKVHGDRYDYSQITHVYSAETVPIVCSTHGVFPQRPHSHLSGNGCPRCAGHARLTREEFIARARSVHGRRYSYAKVVYVNLKKKVTIVCPRHRDFLQSPGNHLKGQGCPLCGGSAKHLTETFVQDALKVHGNRYTYGRVSYTSNKRKVSITCPRHGDFQQTPHSHLGGNGCPRCGRTSKMTQEEFVSRAQCVHHGRYSYCGTAYVNNHTPVSIQCPEHGAFPQRPSSHLGGEGCPKCGRLQGAGKIRKTTQDFIAAARRIHGDKYRYDNVDYRGNSIKVHITCPVHDDFPQTPHNHLKGRGCPKCGGWSRLTQEDFVARAQQMHGNKYSYEKTRFKTVHDPVTIICPFHGPFEQLAEKHLRGRGCRKCRMPRGERQVEHYLRTKSIPYEYQYSPEGLRAKQPLWYDFRIAVDGRVGFVEYHGVQHYRPVAFSTESSDYAANVARDEKKRSYAASKGIPLLIIPYTDFNRIPVLMDDFINHMRCPA
jgi:hypothetical protein